MSHSNSKRWTAAFVVALLALSLTLVFSRASLAQETEEATTPTVENQASTADQEQTTEDTDTLKKTIEEILKEEFGIDQEKQADLDLLDRLFKMKRIIWGFWSLLFTTFGLLMGIVILFLIWQKQDPKGRYRDFFAEGQFVQLIVIIVIAGNVCSLGIMGILEKGEISTIYAGIVGYILGKRNRSGKSGSAKDEDNGNGEKAEVPNGSPLPSPK